MKCSKCGAEYQGNFCPNCGAVNTENQQNVSASFTTYNSAVPQQSGESPSPKAAMPVYKKWWFWVIIGVVVIAIIGSVFGTNGDTNNTGSANGSAVLSSASTPGNNGSSSAKTDSSQLTFGDKFTFDNLEITISDNISWDKVDNQFSDHNGKTVVRVPVTIKNISDDTHSLNMFYYKVYGSQGNELDSVSFLFDDVVDKAGDMRSGATQNTSFVFLYDGDGDYYIEFDNYKEKIEVKMHVEK